MVRASKKETAESLIGWKGIHFRPSLRVATPFAPLTPWDRPTGHVIFSSLRPLL